MKNNGAASEAELRLLKQKMPVQVAFLQGKFDALWVVNRFIDAIFIADICLQFFIAFGLLG